MNDPVASETMEQLVRRALNSERGIAIDFKDSGKAVHWRQRYYMVRKKMLKSDPASDWRSLTAVLDGSKVKLIPVDAQLNDLEITEL